MKLEKAISWVWGCLLAFIVSSASVCCLATGFYMTVDIGHLVIWCAATSLFCSVCYVLPLGPVPITAAGLLGALLWQSGKLEETFQSLIYRLSRQYDLAYGWGILRLGMRTAEDLETTLELGLCILGVLIAMAVAWAVCKRKPIFPAIVLGLLPLAACLVVTDTVPEQGWLYLLLLGIILLLLTHTTRRQDETQGNRLCTLLVLPVGVLLLVLFAAVPRETYTGQVNAQNMVDTLLHTELVENLFGRFVETGTTGSSVDGGTVQLTTVGIRRSSQAEVLRVTGNYSDHLYLRGRALDAYDGLTWTDSGTGTEKLRWEVFTGEKGGEVVITTKYAHRMLYLPYYTESIDLNTITRGKENTKKLTQYSFACYQMPEAAVYRETFPSPQTPASYDLDVTPYLHLSDSVKQWAVPLAQQIVGDIKNPYHQALAIGSYVRSSGKYDTETRRMPGSEDDFALWFLEDSETGYCVHFATAATVLLQAAGIPARYVTGYTAEVKRGLTTVVRSDNAHAWAEYWIPGFGWTVLEATPSSEEGEMTTAPETEATVPVVDPTQPSGEQTQKPIPDTRPGTTNQENPPAQERKINFGAILRILGILAAVLTGAGVIILQRVLRIRIRKKRFAKAGTNRQAILLWQMAVRYAKLLGQMPEAGLFDIAQKAKFSQHTLTQEELLPLINYLQERREELELRSVFCRLWYRIVLALY